MGGATASRVALLFDRGVEDIVIRSGWRDTLADLASRRKESWPLLALVGAIALFALVVGGGDAPAQVAPPATSASGGEPSPGATEPSSSLFVHVAGAVREPGLYEFPAGARVADAIHTAGGALPKADVDALNLAEPLVDGAKVHVVTKGEQPVASVSPTSPQDRSAIALNSADQTQLETIPGIGPVTALAILEHREEVGGFESIEQLLDVDGIGPATLDEIRSYLTL